MSIELETRSDLTGDTYTTIVDWLGHSQDEPHELKWLCDTTEKWCRDRAVYNALLESIQIADGNSETMGRDAIPSILTDALSVSFDNSVGHDYLYDSDERFEFYHRVEEKIPFDLEMFNKITKGGLGNKTLNIALEMAEEKIAERIDANLLNVNVQQLETLPKIMFDQKITRISKKTQGRLIVKEYPTASAHCGHFKALLQELSIKKSFVPDIIFVDYLNICSSTRFKGAIVNSYTYVKAIAEELRGLAGECNVPIVSATQTTRSGFASSDPDLTDTSESFGLPATADLMFALISSEELEGEGKLMVKQLKNRYNDPTMNKRFVVGIDRNKMRLYDCKDQAKIIDSGQKDDESDDNIVNVFGKSKFNDFKV